MKRGAASTNINLYPAKVIVACLKKYNPDRLTQFLDFGIDEGLAQLAGVPLPQAVATPIAKSQEQQLIEMAEAAIKWAKVSMAAQSNPGDLRQLEAVLGSDKPTLEGYATCQEMAESNGLTLTAPQARAVGMIMAGIVKGRKEVGSLPKVRKSYKQPNGKWQTATLNMYPLSMTANFLSACAALAIF